MHPLAGKSDISSGPSARADLLIAVEEPFMSCWVAPSIAAEIWGIPVQQILRMIEAGELTTRDERGWTFVDVAPESPVLVSKPPTYTPLSDDELSALQEETPAAPEAFDEEEPGPDPDQEESTFKGWRSARGRTSKLRLAPPKFANV
jgi:hypothetical protein